MESEASERAVREQFPVFTEAVLGRLLAGAREYGDASFSREPGELLGEIEQELLDVMGWTFVLWVRLQKAKSAIDGAL